MVTETDGMQQQMSGMVTESNFTTIFAEKKNALGEHVINSINVSTEGITIRGDKIQITGDTQIINKAGQVINFFGNSGEVFNINNGVFKVMSDGYTAFTKGMIGNDLYVYGSGISTSSSEFAIVGDGFQISKDYMLYVNNSEMFRVYPDYPSTLVDAVLEVYSRSGRKAIYVQNGGIEAKDGSYGIKVSTAGVQMTRNNGSSWFKLPVVLAVGRVNGGTSPSITKSYTVSGLSLSVTRISEGYYRVNTSGLGITYYPIVVGYGAAEGYTIPKNALKATLVSYSSSSFYFILSDDETANDGDCLYMLVAIP